MPRNLLSSLASTSLPSLSPLLSQAQNGSPRLTRQAFRRRLPVQHITWTALTNRALLDYAGQLAHNDLLPTSLPEKTQKARWLKPKKTHDRVTKRSATSAEAAEKA